MPSHDMQQTQRQTQGVVLTPQLRQALRIMQIPAAELHREIAEELAANPLLEEIPPGEQKTGDELPGTDDNDGEIDFSKNDTGDAGDDFSDVLPDSAGDELTIGDNDFRALKKLDDDLRDDFYDEQRARHDTGDNADAGEHREFLFESAPAAGQSLQEKLLAQARDADTPPDIFAALQILLGNLDERGYMPENLDNLSLEFSLPRAAFNEAWRLLKTFEPAGIGAADLRECLLLQLLQTGRRHTLAALILDECFPLLLKRKIPEIARFLETEPDDVRDALAVIATLDTAPARRFAEDENRIITPDIIARPNEDGTDWEIILNDENIPKLRLNDTYKNLIGDAKLSAADRAYISEKIRTGKFLIGAIRQRQSTLENIAKLLLKHQAEFFAAGPAKLRPLTMQTLAGELGVHEATVSRAVSGKYIKTPHGVFELRYFFTAGITTDAGETIANTGVREILADIIAREDPEKPLSDEQLVEALKKRGIGVARRTAAKYRDALKIPPAHLRKRH